jgi:hypothetical protein
MRYVCPSNPIKQKYDIDHRVAFTLWLNNDLCNLLPIDRKIQNQKSDRLPTEEKLQSAKERIHHWRQEAWEIKRNAAVSRVVV